MPFLLVLLTRTGKRGNGCFIALDDFLKVLEGWGFGNKVSTVTMTNADHGDCPCPELIEFVKTHIQEKKRLEVSRQLFQVYCCGEMISLMVQDAFDKIKDSIDKIITLVVSYQLQAKACC